MRDVFRWAGIDRFHKRLRVQQPGAHPDGLYLHFAEEYTIGDDQVGKVYVGADGMDTTFDVLLAEAPPNPRLRELRPRFVLMARVPWAGHQREYEDQGEDWVVWDLDGGKVSLSSNFHPWCLVRLEEAPGGAFTIVVYREEQKILMRLRMDISALTELQMKMGRRDVNGISFARAIRGKKYKVRSICFNIRFPLSEVIED